VDFPENHQWRLETFSFHKAKDTQAKASDVPHPAAALTAKQAANGWFQRSAARTNRALKILSKFTNSLNKTSIK